MAALMGPNGAGKSTLLNLIAGVLRPTAGRLAWCGADLSLLPPRERARRIAMVPQTLTAPAAYSVRECVSLGRTPYLRPLRGETDVDRDVVRRVLEETGTAELADRSMGELSGGERQRVALALALAQEPEVLLLDEATAHLDLKHQVALLDLVRRLNRTPGMTVLAAIHDPNLAPRWFDGVLLLHRGRIAASGSPAEVLEAERLAAVFEVPLHVTRHPLHGGPLIVLGGAGEEAPTS
jgi:iron complex transport system ATP-binding protein